MKTFLLIIVFQALPAWAGPASFNFSGTLTTDGVTAISQSNNTVKFEVCADASCTCVLYTETQTSVDTSSTNGAVSLNVGSVGGSFLSGLNWNQMFASSGSAVGCFSPSNSPRYLRVTVNSIQLSPNMVISSVPMANVADVANTLAPNSSIAGDLRIGASGRLFLANPTAAIGLSAPASLTTGYNMTLPGLGPNANQILVADGVGGSSWQNLPAPFSPALFNSSFTGASNGLLVNNGSNWQALTPPSTFGQVLTYNGSTLAWQPISSSFSSAVTSTGIISGATFTSTNNGVPSVPSYTSSLDTTSGVYFPSSGTVGFTTAGTERMRVASNGNVGILNSSPTYALDVNGNIRSTSPLIVPTETPSSPSIQFGTSGSGIFGDVSGNIGIANFGVQYTTFMSTGQVGIGTTNPNALLDVEMFNSGGVAVFYNNMTNPGQPVVQMGGASNTSPIVMIANNDSASTQNGPALQIGINGTSMRTVKKITFTGTPTCTPSATISAGSSFMCSWVSPTGGFTMPSSASAAFYQCYSNSTPAFTGTGYGTPGSSNVAFAGIGITAGSISGSTPIICEVTLF